MSNTIPAQVEALGERHSPLMSKTATAAHEAVDVVAAKLINTEEKIRNVAAESSQRFNDSQERARAQVKKSMQTFKSATQNPLIVAGAALVVGAIVASLFRRD